MTIRWRDDDEEPELTPAERRRAAYEQRKYALSRAWLRPAVSPWEASSPGGTWYAPVQSQVANVMIPAARNVAKGAGLPDPAAPGPAASDPLRGAGPVTAEEIAEAKARERAEFAERLRRRHEWNLEHL
jgi:hypothetical protein